MIMDKEPKFKIGQMVYLVKDDWYDIRYDTFTIRGIDADYDYKEFLYKDVRCGTTYHKETKCFGSLDDLKVALIERLTKGVTERISKITTYKEEVADEIK